MTLSTSDNSERRRIKSLDSSLRIAFISVAVQFSTPSDITSGAGALLIGFKPVPFLIVLFGRGGGNIVKRRSSTTTSATATSLGVTVIVVEFPFVVLCNLAGKGFPTTFLPLLEIDGLTIFGERFAGAAFLATFLTGAFLIAFLAGAFLAGFLDTFFTAFFAAFLAVIFFGTDPPVSLKLLISRGFDTQGAKIRTLRA